MRESREKTVALLSKFSRLALSRIALLLAGQSILQDRGVHAAIDGVDYQVAPTLDFLGARIKSYNFLNRAYQNTAEDLELPQQLYHGKSECPPLAAMPGDNVRKVVSRLASKKFDDLIDECGKMVFELSITNVVNGRRPLRITANFVAPSSENLVVSRSW